RGHPGRAGGVRSRALLRPALRRRPGLGGRVGRRAGGLEGDRRAGGGRLPGRHREEAPRPFLTRAVLGASTNGLRSPACPERFLVTIATRRASVGHDDERRGGGRWRAGGRRDGGGRPGW